MKSGIKTSEFWGVRIAQAATAALMTLYPDRVTPELAAALIAGVEAAYTIGRSWVKVAEAKAAPGGQG